MSYYRAYYGSWTEPGGVVSIDFGENRGIPYLYKIDNRKEAFRQAQEVANETGRVVTVLIDTPVAGYGLRGASEKVYPIRGKIKFVRMTKQYRENWYDVIYHSGRVVTYTEPELPATVVEFVKSSMERVQQYDRTMRRDEMIYY